MTQTEATLAALVGSRLCHDLISPVGAIQNGLELIALSGGTSNSPEMSLIEDSCASAAARIRFFRVAFGLAGELQNMGPREIETTLDGMTKGGRTNVIWTCREDCPRREVQLAFLAFLCCDSALVHGGEVRIDRDAAGWTLTGSGRTLSVDPALWDHLNGSVPLDEPEPNRVHFAMLPILAGQAGKSILAQERDGQVVIKIA